MRKTFALLAILTAAPAPLAAQQALPQPEPSQFRPLRIAKWASLLGSAAAAVYGLQQNERADDAYEQLEALCLIDAERCRDRAPGGAYRDADMERQYQEVRSYDSRARTALVAGQVGVAASAALFIIDLRNNRPPGNIPYDPNRLELGLSRDGGVRAGLRLVTR